MAIVEGARDGAGEDWGWVVLPGLELHLVTCWGVVGCYYVLDPPRSPVRTVFVEAAEELAAERRKTGLAWTVGQG